MCLFGSYGVSFLNIEISCQVAKTENFYFRKSGYRTCLEKLEKFGSARIPISALAAVRGAEGCCLVGGTRSPQASPHDRWSPKFI